MRMGKPEKARRGDKATRRAKFKGKPKHAAAGSVVGQLSPDIISTYYAPELIAIANDVLARYTQELLEYHDALKEYEKEADAQVGDDGSIKISMDAPVPPKAPLFRSQFWVRQLEETLSDTSDYFQGNDREWKIQAKAARFERRMAEKYGIFLPFLKEHPEVEHFVRSVQRKYSQGSFSPFRQGKSPIPKSTAVVILFMMHRGKVSWQITLLATLFFLVGLQPWALVVLVAGAHTFVEGYKRRPRKPMAKRIRAVKPYYAVTLGDEEVSKEVENRNKNTFLQGAVGTKLGDKEDIDGSEYDTIILGHGPSALYTGALLSRSGRKVLVLSSKADASGCYTFENAPANIQQEFVSVPFDVEGATIGKISKQQKLLAPALASSTDPQGGVRFAKIGSASDGYAFEILAIPGIGNGEDSLFVLRADGTASLMEEAASSLGDGWPGINGELGSSTTGIYAATCKAINASSNQFYLSKVLSDSINNMQNASTYQETAIRYASAFLDKGFPVNPHTRSLMAAIGMKSENIKPSMTSMGAHVTNIGTALCGEGMHYPIGGPRALCHAFATVIEQNGGRIVTQVPIASLVFEEGTAPKTQEAPAGEGKTDDLVPPRCLGVKLADDRQIIVDPTRWKTHETAIVSMHGFVTTFIRLLPEDIRVLYKVPRGLPALSEQRPVFKIMFALDGNAKDLELSGADFYRLPGAALAQDEIDPVTGQIKPGEIGWIDDKETSEPEIIVDEVNKDTTGNPQESLIPGTREKPPVAKRKPYKFETGVSYLHIAFPSAKDPSFESRHGKVSTCVVTIEADDDFVTFFDTKPKLYAIQKGKESSGDLQRLIERVRKDLFENFPQLRGKVVHSELVGPVHRGLSHNPERFAAKGVRPTTPYPGLYVGGSDLTVESSSGAFVGGWLAANAVMQYTWMDYLFFHKNVTSDIIRHLEPPDVLEEEDLAVPPFQIETSSIKVED